MYIIRGTPFLPPFLSPPYYCWWRWGGTTVVGGCLLDGRMDIRRPKRNRDIYVCNPTHNIVLRSTRRKPPTV